MKIHTQLWDGQLEPSADAGANLVLVFGSREALGRDGLHAGLRAQFPGAILFGCSTAGEILGDRVLDDSVTLTAVSFASTSVRIAVQPIADRSQSGDAGRALVAELASEDLRHVIVLSDGLHVNGTALANGMYSALPRNVAVTGGLAADAALFSHTLVYANGVPAENLVAAIGLYGEALRVGCGSLGGWDAFGPYRLITRARGNILYELDGQSALALYKRYLGSHSADLPASALLFPLALAAPGERFKIVRTVLAIDETEQSMTFAGDVPEGGYVRLMKANFDRLVDGAIGAAKSAVLPFGQEKVELALLISCVGRKLVLNQRIEEEIEGVRRILGAGVPFTGFYSYGEIAPQQPSARCELHNQTMTITTLSEVQP